MLNWNTKQRSRNNAAKEVSVRLNRAGLSSSGEEKQAIVFRFYGDSHKKIVNNNDYMVFAIEESLMRVYFKESNPIEGYKVIATNPRAESTSKTVAVTITNPAFWEDCIGDYDLHYDRDEKLYYIDLAQKSTKTK